MKPTDQIKTKQNKKLTRSVDDEKCKKPICPPVRLRFVPG